MSTYQYSLNPFYMEIADLDESESEDARFNFLPTIKKKSIKISKLDNENVIKPNKFSADLFMPRMVPDWEDYFSFEET